MKKYTDEQFIQAVKESYSIAQVLKKLELKAAGGNYRSCNDRIKKLQLSTSHFKGMGWSKDLTIGPKRPIKDYLDNIIPIKSHKLKVKLFYENLKNKQCEVCKHSEWNNKPIALELHHIDGNSDNNNLTNLQILCPNCHAQTDYYRNNKK